MANDIVLTSAGLLRDCLRFRPTHIFVPQFSVALVCYPAIILLRLFGVKCFLRLGNPPPPDKFYERLFRWVLAPITSLFIANSYYTRRELLSCGVPPRKVTVIFNTTPTRRTIALVTKPDPHKIVFIGQVIPPKGVHKLLDAVAILRRRGHDVNLDVVGEIEGWESPSYAGYRQKLRKRAAAPDLAGHIHFLGYREDIPARLAAGAIHCCPSTPAQREGFGIVNLEAKAAGLPSVVTPFGALPEVIEHKVDGFVCRDDSPAALAEGLEYFLSDPERRARAAEAARASAEKFSRETFSQCWWDTFTVADPALLRNRLPDPANELSDVRVMACFGAMVFVAGMERVAFEVLRVLREAGASLHVIVNGWENHRIIPWAEDLGASWSTGRYYGHLSRHARNPVALLSMLYEVSATSAGLLRDCWRFRPTHIFFPDFVSVLRNFPAVLLLRQMGKKIVLKASTAPPDHVTYQRLWKYAVSPLVDEIIGVSDFVRREVISTGVPESKVRSIYNSVTTRIPSNGRDVPRDPRKVIYVGQIHPGKGVHLLLEAIATVAKRGRDLHLDVVGDLDAWEPPNFRGYRASLVERASQPDLLGRVNFLGFREDVADCMKAAAIHCCPSLPEIKEALGLVNLEAKTCGTPSVVFCSGGVPELFRHRQDGWICEQPTADALAEGIEYFLDPVVQEKASVAARESSAAFVRQRFAEEWRSVFRQ